MSNLLQDLIIPFIHPSILDFAGDSMSLILILSQRTTFEKILTRRRHWSLIVGLLWFFDHLWTYKLREILPFLISKVKKRGFACKKIDSHNLSIIIIQNRPKSYQPIRKRERSSSISFDQFYQSVNESLSSHFQSYQPIRKSKNVYWSTEFANQKAFIFNNWFH